MRWIRGSFDPLSHGGDDLGQTVAGLAGRLRRLAVDFDELGVVLPELVPPETMTLHLAWPMIFRSSAPDVEIMPRRINSSRVSLVLRNLRMVSATP